MHATTSEPERIHPALWRASQLSRSPGHYIDTGYAAVSAELPGGGWPLGNLIDILIQQPGIGELQLLRPALLRLGERPVVFVHPPFLPQASAWSSWGGLLSCLLWARPGRTADALWTAEQVLRSGAFAAVLLWQDAVRNQSLRRLQLAAQEGNTLFVLMRPLAAAQQTSPAPLRLALQPAPLGLNVSILKRRGGTHEGPIQLQLYPETRFSEFDHAIMDRRASVARKSRHAVPELAH
ncbi:translesion DNA synthesis-associated protein ImuA [Candidimonas sp. SYP-B2681]|uniref:translesion DNA synthesis-associated protein ImuA n=1 Tax=Candidimonas sp. SYP-B2681 TaxID=2497686 RepID=UPI000F8821EA|nr:translesion DNA synthesis-associated protein ImuA [Candidimonas sp. SYP-B2681]RTZ48126.1 translesion DNA synthesis-associated protein ImuA [Candidimonas sp. SYP-B2681]